MSRLVVALGILRFPPEQMEEVRPHRKKLAEAAYERDRCIACDLAEDLFEPGWVRFSEQWPDRESLERHPAAPQIEPWRQAARRCGLPERSFTAYRASASWEV